MRAMALAPLVRPTASVVRAMRPLVRLVRVPLPTWRMARAWLPALMAPTLVMVNANLAMLRVLPVLFLPLVVPLVLRALLWMALCVRRTAPRASSTTMVLVTVAVLAAVRALPMLPTAWIAPVSLRSCRTARACLRVPSVRMVMPTKSANLALVPRVWAVLLSVLAARHLSSCKALLVWPLVERERSTMVPMCVPCVTLTVPTARSLLPTVWLVRVPRLS